MEDDTQCIKKGYQKRIWLITYGASCTSITHTMCSEFGVDIDQCYTLSQRDFKYTLIHLVKKTTAMRIHTMLNGAEMKYGIKQNNLFGYDSVTGNDSELQDHPGMKLMIHHMNRKDTCFESWLLKSDIYTNSKGVMHRFLTTEDIPKLTRSQLEFYTKKVEEKLKEHRERTRECEHMNEGLSLQNEELREDLEKLKDESKKKEQELRKVKAENQELRLVNKRLKIRIETNRKIISGEIKI